MDRTEDSHSFKNFYLCDGLDGPHGHDTQKTVVHPPHLWADEWDSQCDDRCPLCRFEHEPFASSEDEGEIDFLVSPERLVEIYNLLSLHFPEEEVTEAVREFINQNLCPDCGHFTENGKQCNGCASNEKVRTIDDALPELPSITITEAVDAIETTRKPSRSWDDFSNIEIEGIRSEHYSQEPQIDNDNPETFTVYLRHKSGEVEAFADVMTHSDALYSCGLLESLTGLPVRDHYQEHVDNRAAILATLSQSEHSDDIPF